MQRVYFWGLLSKWGVKRYLRGVYRTFLSSLCLEKKVSSFCFACLVFGAKNLKSNDGIEETKSLVLNWEFLFFHLFS